MTNTAAATATTIRQQIGTGILWSLGATDFAFTTEARGGLTFKARILPFTKSGRRGTTARVMRVTVTLTDADLYDVRVGWLRGSEWVEHYAADGLYADQMVRTMFALDYDGAEALNPRMAA